MNTSAKLAKKARGAKLSQPRLAGLGGVGRLGALRRHPKGDDGQLMMLAGIVITIAFILTALTFSQVASLEKQAVSEAPSPVITEWRFLHERLASNFETAVSTETTKEDFVDTTMPIILATFRAIEAEKGYDLLLRLAEGPQYDPSEDDLLDGGSYARWSADGAAQFTDTFDGTDDGLLFENPCPDPTDSNECLSGAYVYVRLTDGTTVMEETVLFAVNHP